jgi:hypothetical protein
MVTITNDAFFCCTLHRKFMGSEPNCCLAAFQELVDALQAKLPTNQVGVFKGKSMVA